MAPAAVLTRGLQTVRAEFNTVFFDRDKASDGWIGDLAHQQESASGHNPDITGAAEYKDGDSLNEVRAIDVDKDLKFAGVTMELVIQYLVKRARAGIYIPFRYIIFNGRIWSRSTGWETREYTGANKHDKHAHFSGDYTQKADNWTGSLGLASLGGEDMALDKADVGTIANTDGVITGPSLAASVKDGSNPAWSLGGFLRDISNYARINEDHIADLNGEVAKLKASLAELAAKVGTGTAPVVTQEQVNAAMLAAIRALAAGDPA